MTTPDKPKNIIADSTKPKVVTAAKPQSIYCLACRSYTDNKSLRIETVCTNGKERKIEKAICVKCEKRKNRFISSSNLPALNINDEDTCV